jgi:hypothetical protein
MKRAQLRESTCWVCSVSLNLMFGTEHQISNEVVSCTRSASALIPAGAGVSATKGAHEAGARVESQRATRKLQLAALAGWQRDRAVFRAILKWCRYGDQNA